MKRYPYIEVSCIDDLPTPCTGTNIIAHYVFQYIDFNLIPTYALENKFVDCCFFGCELPKEMYSVLESSLVLPRMNMRYQCFRKSLYDGMSLYAGFDPENDATYPDSFDYQVYNDYAEQGCRINDIRIMLSRSLHDHSISDALYDFIDRYREDDITGIMGGHALKRTDKMYKQIVLISKSLTEKGKLMISGGGPGAMEATHLGAWMAGRDKEDVYEALRMLSVAPTYKDAGWLASAFWVMHKFPQERFHSLGIPTWYYGHEQSTPFATDIAKFFDNGIREEVILSISKGGIIFTPGSAGTIQEIFQDAAQNHYSTYGPSSPMIFFGEEYYNHEIPVYPLISDLLERGKYQKLRLSITDNPQEVIDTLLAF